MPVPDGLRLHALFDGTNRRPSLRNLAALLLYKAPSRLWHEQDARYRRTSLWTDVLLVRWLRSQPNGTVLVATRPALVLLASMLAPAGVIVIGQEHKNLSVYSEGMRNAMAAALQNVSAFVTLTESDRAAYQDCMAGKVK